MWVDEKTGCILKLNGYDIDGRTSYYIDTKEIAFDNHPLVVPTFKLEQYNDYTNLKRL